MIRQSRKILYVTVWEEFLVLKSVLLHIEGAGLWAKKGAATEAKTAKGKYREGNQVFF